MIMYCLNVLDIIHVILYIKNDTEISSKSHWIEKNLNSKYKVILSFIYNINKYCLLSYQLRLSIIINTNVYSINKRFIVTLQDRKTHCTLTYTCIDNKSKLLFISLSQLMYESEDKSILHHFCFNCWIYLSFSDIFQKRSKFLINCLN